MVRVMVRDAYDTTKLCVVESSAPSITVEQIKHEVNKQHPSKPEPQNQRLILAGRILKDSEVISDDALIMLSIKASTTNKQEFNPAAMNFQPTPWISLPSSASSSPIQVNQSTMQSFNPNAFSSVQSMAIASQMAPVPMNMPQQHQSNNQSINQAVPAVANPAVTAPVVEGRFAGYRRYIDVSLMLKLCVLFLVFGRTENTSRQIGLMVAAIVAYLWQVGAFTRRDAQADAAGDEAAEAVARIRQERRQARGENRNGLAGLLANLGDEQEEDDFEDDIVAQREQLAQMNAQHRAELIRRNAYPPAENGVVPAEINRIEAAEKFIVGLFASLHPSWRCRELDQ